MKKITKKTASAIIIFFSFSVTAPAYANHDNDGCRNPSGRWGCGGRWDINRNFTYNEKSYGKWIALGFGIFTLGILGYKALSQNNEKPNLVIIEPNGNNLEQSRSPVGQNTTQQKVIDTYVRDKNGILRKKVSRTDTNNNTDNTNAGNNTNNNIKIYNTEVHENNDGPPVINW